jgi:hypothetical protein
MEPPPDKPEGGRNEGREGRICHLKSRVGPPISKRKDPVTPLYSFFLYTLTSTRNAGKSVDRSISKGDFVQQTNVKSAVSKLTTPIEIRISRIIPFTNC